MWFEDLQPCTYFPFIPAKLVAVGWLERGKAYSRGGMPSRPAAPVIVRARAANQEDFG